MQDERSLPARHLRRLGEFFSPHPSPNRSPVWSASRPGNDLAVSGSPSVRDANRVSVPQEGVENQGVRFNRDLGLTNLCRQGILPFSLVSSSREWPFLLPMRPMSPRRYNG